MRLIFYFVDIRIADSSLKYLRAIHKWLQSSVFSFYPWKPKKLISYFVKEISNAFHNFQSLFKVYWNILNVWMRLLRKKSHKWMYLLSLITAYTCQSVICLSMALTVGSRFRASLIWGADPSAWQSTSCARVQTDLIRYHLSKNQKSSRMSIGTYNSVITCVPSVNETIGSVNMQNYGPERRGVVITPCQQ